MVSYRLSFLDAYGNVPQKSGLNWGLAHAHVNPEDGYVPIRIDALRSAPGLFDPKSVTTDIILAYWDDGEIMECLLEGSQEFNADVYAKQISSFNDKSIFGSYIRRRMNITSDRLISREDFERYGRSDITVTRRDDGNYTFDFSVTRG